MQLIFVQKNMKISQCKHAMKLCLCHAVSLDPKMIKGGNFFFSLCGADLIAEKLAAFTRGAWHLWFNGTVYLVGLML